VKAPPLSDDNKKQIREAMSKRYVPENKALDLSNFGADQTFGGSSGATGKLNDDRVMEVVIETIGVHLPDLEALSLTNNGLKTLRVLSKIVEKAPKIKVLYLDRNKLMQCKELDNVSKLNLNVLKLDGNPFLGNFKDGTDYSNQLRKKFRSLQILDGNQLPQLIMFEEVESTSTSTTIEIIPGYAKMVVNEQIEDYIGRFMREYFKVYDTNNREQLASAYHENAMISLQAYFPIKTLEKTIKYDYLPESRNLNMERVYVNSRKGRLLHQKRTQIIGFLDRLPKTQHDITSFTLDVPFATDRLMTVSVTVVILNSL
jgi:nuclear RNA export factor